MKMSNKSAEDSNKDTNKNRENSGVKCFLFWNKDSYLLSLEADVKCGGSNTYHLKCITRIRVNADGI